MSENKINFIMAVRGYKLVKKEKTVSSTEFTVLDSLNKKMLLRIVEPLTSEYIGLNEVKNTVELVKRESFDSAIIISRQFTDAALEEMTKQKIQHVSENYMPPFDIQELYLAIVNCANNQCQKKCGKVLLPTSDCKEKIADFCRIKALVINAKNHFEEGTVGLLKNDLKLALALNR